MEDDALRDDNSGASGGFEVLGHVVHKEDFAALGLDGEALVGLDAAFRGHEGRVSENDVGKLVPALLGGEGVVFVDVGIGEAVEVEVDQRQAHHVGRNVVTLKVLSETLLVVESEVAIALLVDVSAEDVLVGGDEEPGGAAGGVEDGLVLLRGENLDHEIDDVARGAELPGITLTAKDAEQILEGVAQALAVVVAEPVDDFEESLEGLGVAVRQVSVFEDAPEKGGDAGVFRHLGNAFPVEAEHLVPAKRGGHEPGPAVFGVVGGEELALAAEFLGLGIHVIHELVDQGDGDLLDLRFGVGDFADKDVAGGVDAAFGGGV